MNAPNVKRGPGRPAKPKAPRSAQQGRLAASIETAEDALEVAAAAYQGARTVTHEVALLSCELSVSSAWAAYLRAAGDFTNASRCSTDSAKTASNLCRLRELVAVDQIAALQDRAAREDALRKGGKE